MSKTYTARPAQSNRGRGTNTTPGRPTNNTNHPARGGVSRAINNTRGVQGRATATRNTVTAPRGRNMNQPPGRPDLRPGNDGHNDLNPPSNQPPQAIQTRTEIRSAYTVIRPDEKKRDKIQQQSKKEEQSYQAYKDSKKVTYVSCSGTVGGGQVHQDDVRHKTQQQHNRTPMERRQRTEQYRADQKAREDAEYNKKKEVQRRKTEENERREAAHAANIRDEHRRHNNAFLDRMDQQTRAAHSKKILSSSAAKSFGKQDNRDEEPRFTDPSYHSPEGAQGGSTIHHTPDNNSWQAPESTPSVTSAPDLTQLIDLYPHYQPEVLCQILSSCGGDLQAAIDLLEV